MARRKALIERPIEFGALVALASVVVGVFWGKTWEQQALNVLLGFLAGVVVAGIVLAATNAGRGHRGG